MNWVIALSIADGGRGRAEIREQEVDSLLRECHLNYLPGCTLRIQSEALRVRRGNQDNLLLLKSQMHRI